MMASPLALTTQVESDIVSELTLFLEDQARRKADRVVLAQKVGDTLHTVNDWSLAEMLDTRTLASAMHAAGLREAQTLRESVAYGVFAFRSESNSPSGRFYFRVEVGASWVGSAETPDERGLIGMLMRHTESAERLALGHSREIVDQYQTLLVQEHAHNARLLEQAYARIRVLEAREAENIDLREKLQTHALERHAQIDAMKRADDRKDEMRKFALEKLGPAVPIFLAKFLGAGASAAAPTSAAGAAAEAAAAAGAGVNEELIDRLIDSMAPDQVQAVARLLTQEQLLLFGQIYELAYARIQRAQQKQQPAQPETPQQASSAIPPAPAPPSTQERPPGEVGVVETAAPAPAPSRPRPALKPKCKPGSKPKGARS